MGKSTSKWILNKITNALFVLNKIEKSEKTENSIYNTQFKNIEKLKRHRSKKSSLIKFSIQLDEHCKK